MLVAYRDVALFSLTYYGMDELIMNTNIYPGYFVGLYALFVFDMIKQNEILKLPTIDVKIGAELSATFPANTTAYPLIISDKILTFRTCTISSGFTSAFRLGLV